MTLAADINDACHALPLLDRHHRHCLIERILGQLETYYATAVQGVPPDKHIWIDTLIFTVRGSVDEISMMETTDLLDILREFEKLIHVLECIAASKSVIPTHH
ncbi:MULTISPECIES: hypothetical protein [unclassified Rhizobium]|jgi:hypothetical protein|uniref:hypothetical protein n=1 Tax=unclassified Rhizobium TaxID=2613769 RepID=UPI000DBABB49|nr:hypothetical protein [Rhizobium sp. AN80A]